jgi:hypothetical protein
LNPDDISHAPSAAEAFSYLSVLLSIILGLAITQVLKGVRGLLLSRARVVMYWPTLLLAGLLLLMCVQAWWTMFQMREIVNWTFAKFAIVLLQTIITYMLTAIVLPDFFGERTVDLHEHYFEHHRLFFGLLVLLLVVSLTKGVVLGGHMTDNVDLGFHLGFITIAVIAAITRREWYHKTISVLSALAFGAYIALLFAKLR